MERVRAKWATPETTLSSCKRLRNFRQRLSSDFWTRFCSRQLHVTTNGSLTSPLILTVDFVSFGVVSRSRALFSSIFGSVLKLCFFAWIAVLRSDRCLKSRRSCELVPPSFRSPFPPSLPFKLKGLDFKRQQQPEDSPRLLLAYFLPPFARYKRKFPPMGALDESAGCFLVSAFLACALLGITSSQGENRARYPAMATFCS